MSLDDWAAYYRQVQGQGESASQRRPLFRMYLCLGAVAGATVGLLATGKVHPAAFVVAAVTATVFTSIFFAYLWPSELTGESQFLKRICAYPDLLAERTVELTDDEMVERSAAWDMRLRWRAMTALRKSRAYIFFAYGTGGGKLVPRAAFATAADFEAFAATAQERFKAHHPDKALGFPVKAQTPDR